MILKSFPASAVVWSRVIAVKTGGVASASFAGLSTFSTTLMETSLSGIKTGTTAVPMPEWAEQYIYRSGVSLVVTKVDSAPASPGVPTIVNPVS